MRIIRIINSEMRIILFNFWIKFLVILSNFFH